MQEKRIVVIGAGVSGLTTALLLSKNPRYSITVAAKHMPGDYDIDYASPWAGADYLPVSKEGTEAAEWDRVTWYELQDLATNHLEAGVCFRKCYTCTRTQDSNDPDPKFPLNPWWKELFTDYKDFPKEQLPNELARAASFTSVCINTAIYLPYLVSRCLASGVIFKRATFPHITSVSGSHHIGLPADLIVNCTGLSSLTLGGVEDTSMYPIRGQTVLVRNDAPGNFSLSGTDDGPDEGAYLMSRAAGGGTILGGCTQKGVWNGEVDSEMTRRIMKRAVALCPALGTVEELDVVRCGVGLRPAREGGVRVERETVEGYRVVHNYGHAGYGYQCSYGCANEAVRLVEEAFADGWLGRE